MFLKLSNEKLWKEQSVQQRVWGARWRSGSEEGGRGRIHLQERSTERESTEQLKYPLPDCQKQELFPSLHHYYSQTLPISKPLEKFASFSSLTMKWFKQGNLYQPLKKFCFSKVVLLSLDLNLLLVWFRELQYVKGRVRMIINVNIKCWKKKKTWPREII